MGATHSSQHTAPDAKHSSTRCCPTHEMWELPTPLIVANRSQQRDEVYESYPLVLNRHPAGSNPRPAEEPGKPGQQQVGKQTKPLRDMGSNPRIQKISRNCSTTDTNQLSNSGHGFCEYMGATHSSQHTTPDAKHISTRCCPTHDMWELPTPLIVANRSQQRDEVYGSYPLVLNRHPGKMSNTENIQQCKAYTAASIIIHAQSNAVKQAHIRTSSLLCHNYYNRVPSNTDLKPAKPNTNTSSGTVTQKSRIGSYELNQICPTLLTRQKALNKAQRKEMSSHTSPASRKLPKAAPNESSQQEESSAATLTSIGAVYRRQSERIRFGEQ
ncbi:hypothetical protein F511_31680 [Dorcoceras hygrometricum]|uniref:Uncharacterized protein n=1 Tax=Dorcoceras hygrometricum TaxID=472368 RepID=A0A2Z7AHT7_9LAMI|nr:hypothetical protein F511_31680 [Dorcoceras hygrometricum]